MAKQEEYMKKTILKLLIFFLLLSGTGYCFYRYGYKNGSNAQQKTDPDDTQGDMYLNKEAYRQLVTNIDYGEQITYVIGHISPDSDAVTAAVGYADFLNQLGIEAKAVTAGKLNNETRYAFEQLGIEAPEVLQDATGKQFVLVDHSGYEQSIDNMRNARVVGIVDHHGIGDVINTEIINVRSAPVGATASLVYQCFRECGLEIGPQTARALIVGILSNTENLESNVCELDIIAFNDLKEIASIADTDSLYAGMAEARIDYTGMTDYEIFKNDFKKYEANGTTFSLSVASAKDDDAVKKLADRMYDAMVENYDTLGIDMLFAKASNTVEDTMIMIAYPEDAVDLLKRCYDNYDGEKYFVFDNSLSRKKKIVPKIMEILNEE